MAVTAPGVRQRRITVAEYHRMIGTGILGEDEHVQLVDGVLVAMTPQGVAHARVIQRLNAVFVRAVGAGFAVRPQLPLTLLDDSEPEPALAIVRAEDGDSAETHPQTALLVVEVAGDSLRFDRESKAAVYARAGIPEYWIVNLVESAIEVRRDPDPASGGYRTAAVARAGETLTATTVPGVTVDVAALLR